MRSGTRVLGLVAVAVGLLVGAVLLLVPARSEPVPGPVAEIVIGESAGPPAPVVEDPPAPTAFPEVVPPPAPVVGEDDRGEDRDDDRDDADDDGDTDDLDDDLGGGDD